MIVIEKITISEAQKSTSPNQISLICTEKPDGTTNLAAISWWTYLANRPPMIGIAVSSKSYSGELIDKNRQVVLSIPGEAIAKEAFQCGCVSGKDTNKAEKFAIDLITLEETNIKIPAHSKLAFVCTLDKTVDAGDHIFYICNIQSIFCNNNEKQLYAWEGYAKLAPL